MNGAVTRFGQVEFDAAHGRLSVAGRVVEFDRPCVAILALLLAEVSREVDKDRLLEAGWPGRTVHENSLAKAIGRLRHMLGDDAGALETVHGYGYRLAAEVDAAALPDRALPRRRRHFALMSVTAVPITLAVLWGLSDGTYSLEGPRLVKGEPADAIGRVLWVDDHPTNNANERHYLEQQKIAVYQATSSEDALSLLSMYEYGAVISDMNRNDHPLAGLKLVREIRRRHDDTPFFLYTVVSSEAQIKLLAEAGGEGVAVNSAELYAAVLPLFDRNKPKVATN